MIIKRQIVFTFYCSELPWSGQEEFNLHISDRNNIFAAIRQGILSNEFLKNIHRDWTYRNYTYHMLQRLHDN